MAMRWSYLYNGNPHTGSIGSTIIHIKIEQVMRWSHHYNGNSYTTQTASLYWNSLLHPTTVVYAEAEVNSASNKLGFLSALGRKEVFLALVKCTQKFCSNFLVPFSQCLQQNENYCFVFIFGSWNPIIQGKLTMPADTLAPFITTWS